VVKLLLEKGAIANAQDHMKITALHAALYAGQNGVVGLLLTHGADPTIVDGYGRSSLDWVSLHEPTFHIMIEYSKSYHPTDAGTREAVLIQSAIYLINRLRSNAIEKGDHHQLGHSLLHLDDLANACTAFEQDMTVTKGSPKRNPEHTAWCNSCQRDIK
jgi:hypothetical protein